MISDTDIVPTPEFRARLESEILHAHRREVRLGTGRRERLRRQLRAAGIVAVCVAIGTASGLASAQVRDSARRDSLLDASRAELALIGLRLQLAKARHDDALGRARVGVAGADDVAAAEDELRVVEAQAARAQKNAEEMRLSAQPVRDDLNAPLVGGRDFVAERVQLDLFAAQKRLAAAERQQQEAEKRARIGVSSELAAAEARLETMRAQGAFAVLAERRALRKEYLEKGTVIEQLSRRLEAAQLTQDLRVGLQRLELARARAAEVERQRAVGRATELEVMRAQVEMKERELELHQLNAQRKRVMQ